MIAGDQFLTALRAKLPHQPPRIRFYLGEFIQDIERHRIYTPQHSGVDLVDLISDPRRMIEAFYFVNQLDTKGRHQRISASGSFPGNLSPYELTHLQSFVEGLRHTLANDQLIDPETLMIACHAPVMVVMTTVWEQKSHDHEFYLMLHNDLDPLDGLQLLYASMRHWHTVLPTDPTFYGEYTIQ